MDLQAWRNRLKVEVKSLFYLAKALGSDLRAAGQKSGSWLVAATALNGYGDNINGDSFIGQAGVAGLLKTVAQEWPEVTCRVIDLDMTNPASVVSRQLLGEMTAKDGPVEVGYRGKGRLAYRAKPAPLNEDAKEGVQIGGDWVILVTGGAVGITAEVTAELAGKYRPTLLLVGRSPFPEEAESPETAGLTSPKDVKEALIERLRASGETLAPAKVEAAYARLIKDRDIRRNVAEMKEAGATVHYFQADVRDEQSFGALIDEIYKSFGRLDGVIHGAGVIEDKLVQDKSPDSLDRVFDTKADSAFILSRKIRGESLRFIVFFTSVAGCFGNRGQADYAAANEVVNELAVFLDKQWSGRVVAINWGPWKKTGMVTHELEKQFNERGVQLIPSSVGCRMFEKELRLGSKGDVEVVIGGGPWMT
jgi:NAD(P)-dependent dehydrogenase (short-subunit alcohol dehydrogenase family)